MILASHGIIGSQISVAPVAIAATGVGATSFTANWEAYSGAVVYLLDVSASPTFNTFIYEDEQVNAPTTSYVVIGLTENTTYYYRVRASTESLTDPDAAAFFARVTDAGGTLSATEQTAVNTLVVQMKFDGIWDKMKAIYPMVGASAAACAQNLKSSSFTGTFTALGWTFASTGVTPDGTQAFMDTGLIPNNELLLNSTHISGYLRLNNSKSGPILSSEDAINFNNGLYIWPGGTSNSPSVRINDNSSNTVPVLDIRGLHIATRTASNEKKYRINKTERFSLTTLSTGLNVSSIYVSKSRNNNNFYSNSIALITIGAGLTDAQCDLFYDAQQAFQTTLSRQV